MKKLYWARVSGSLCVWIAAPAFAQQPPADTSNMDSDMQVQEIVVTAQRRSQNLQTVPVSVNAVTAAQLTSEGVTDTLSLAESVPGVDTSHTFNGGTPFIRGVGSASATIGSESPVALYVDGVYRPSSAGGIFSLSNVDQIEVIKGPQGTLFGRNATGGVIQIITKEPSQLASIEASIDYGNFNTFKENLYATTGVTDAVAIDVAVYDRHQGTGWGRDLTTGGYIDRTDEAAVRSKLLWQASELTRITLSGDYDRVKSDLGLNLGFAPGSVGLDGLTTYSGFYNSRGNPTDQSYLEQSGASFTVDHDFGVAKIVSITSYRHLHGNAAPYDQDQTPEPIIVVPELQQAERTVTQELQLQSATASFIKWIVGAYYFYDKSGYDGLTISGFASAPLPYIRILANQYANSLSGFGQATVAVRDDTRITAGLRYTSDRRSIDGSTNLGGTGLLTDTNHATFSKPTWRLALDHDFSKDILGYISYNRGFKSGLFNTISYGDPAVQPEVLDAYEVGFKNEFFDHRLRVNGAGFFYDYKNIQLTRVINGATETYNAAHAHIKGVDFDLDGRVTQRLSILGGLAYLDGHYTSFPNAPLYTPNPLGGNTLGVVDATGNDTVRTPKLTLNAGPSLSVPSAVGKFDFSVLYYHNSGFFWTPDNHFRQPSYDILNSAVSWTSYSSGYSARLYVKNLLDRQYYSYADELVAATTTSPAEPRTYGVSFSIKLGGS